MTTIPHAPPDSDDPWLRAALALMDEAVIGTTIDGIVVTWNDGARRLLGYHAREAIGCPRSMLTFPDAWADTHALYEEARVGAPVVSRDVAWLHRDGLILRLPVSRFAVHDTLGHPYGLLEVVHDDGLSYRERPIALHQTVARLAHEMTEPMTALEAYLHAGKRLLDRGLPCDLAKAEAATERALAELARAVDILRRLRVSALRDATLQDVAVRAQHRTDPGHKRDEQA
jgi:PAS domain S-box-containing protein